MSFPWEVATFHFSEWTVMESSFAKMQFLKNGNLYTKTKSPHLVPTVISEGGVGFRGQNLILLSKYGRV